MALQSSSVRHDEDEQKDGDDDDEGDEAKTGSGATNSAW